jgi:hypothetical protein
VPGSQRDYVTTAKARKQVRAACLCESRFCIQVWYKYPSLNMSFWNTELVHWGVLDSERFRKDFQGDLNEYKAAPRCYRVELRMLAVLA